MVTEKEFSSIFDYSSPFKYGSSDIRMKSTKETYKSVFSYQDISIPLEEFENDYKETWASVITRSTITAILYTLALLLFPVSVFICLKKVHALERMVLLRLGKLQPVRGPGFAVILPCVDKWVKVDLKPKTFTVSSSQSLTADGGIVEVKSDVEYRVSDVVSYVMKLRQQESTLRDLSLLCLGNIVSEKDLSDLETKREIINFSCKNELNRSALNWGLEIINVNMHSIKILKAAEPVDVIGTLMTALKDATGQPSQNSSPFLPFMQNIAASCTVSKNDDLPEEKNTDDILDIIRNLIDNVTKTRKLEDLTAKFQLIVAGQSNRKIFLSFDKENVSVFEDVDCSMDCDVNIQLSESVLRQFLGGTLSPLNAYMDGKVTVTGDWKLLKYLARIFQ